MTSSMGVSPAPEAAPTPPAGVVPDAQTAGLAAMAGNSNQVSSSTTIGSLADLKNKAPQVYKAMMQGLAQNLIQDWDRKEKAREQIAKDYDR